MPSRQEEPFVVAVGLGVAAVAAAAHGPLRVHCQRLSVCESFEFICQCQLSITFANCHTCERSNSGKLANWQTGNWQSERVSTGSGTAATY